MNRGIIGGTFALAVCAASALFWYSSQKPVQAPSSKSDEAAIRELRREVGELKEARATDLLVAAQLANVGRAPVPAPSSPPDPVREPSEAAQSPALSDAEQEQAAAKAEAGILSGLERAFASEGRDGRWSGTTANELSRSVREALPAGSNVSSVDCKSRICRLETTHENVEAFREFNTAAFARTGQTLWRGAVYSAVREQSGSSIVALTYLAKEGEVLPDTAN